MGGGRSTPPRGGARGARGGRGADPEDGASPSPDTIRETFREPAEGAKVPTATSGARPSELHEPANVLARALATAALLARADLDEGGDDDDPTAQPRAARIIASIVEHLGRELDATVAFATGRDRTGDDEWQSLDAAAKTSVDQLASNGARTALALGAATVEGHVGLLHVTSALSADDRAFLSAIAPHLACAIVRARRNESDRAARSEPPPSVVPPEWFLDAIIENLPDMIFVKSAERLAFERLNRAGEELLGVSREDLLGKNDFDLFPRLEAEYFQQKDRETLENKVLLDISEEPIATRHGLRWLHTKKVPLLDPEGVPRYLLGISEDITERRAALEALREAKATAEAASAELEAFAYSVAHDVRGPLRGIDGFSQALLEDYAPVLGEEGQKYLKNIRIAAQRMAQLLDDLVTLSHVIRAKMTIVPLDLGEMAHATLDRLKRTAPTRKLTVTIDGGMTVRGDRRLLEIAIDSLLSNAWKFTSKKPHATIHVGKRILDHGMPSFFVEDDGAGFDMRFVDKLFRPFQRLHGMTEFEGTGIGLATVERVMRRHGGRVWADGTVDGGATISFALDPRELREVT